MKYLVERFSWGSWYVVRACDNEADALAFAKLHKVARVRAA